MKKRSVKAKKVAKPKARPPVDVDTFAVELLDIARRCSRAGLEALEVQIAEAASACSRADSDKEARDARSHLAWIAKQATGAQSDLHRMVSQERRHTGRLTLEGVVSWLRAQDQDTRDHVAESIGEMGTAERGLLA